MIKEAYQISNDEKTFITLVCWIQGRLLDKRRNVFIAIFSFMRHTILDPAVPQHWLRLPTGRTGKNWNPGCYFSIGKQMRIKILSYMEVKESFSYALKKKLDFFIF